MFDIQDIQQWLYSCYSNKRQQLKFFNNRGNWQKDKAFLLLLHFLFCLLCVYEWHLNSLALYKYKYSVNKQQHYYLYTTIGWKDLLSADITFGFRLFPLSSHLDLKRKWRPWSQLTVDFGEVNTTPTECKEKCFQMTSSVNLFLHF